MRGLFITATVAAGAVLAFAPYGCGGTDSPGFDAGQEAAQKDYGAPICQGKPVPPELNTCRPGVEGKACAQLSDPAKCINNNWQCPAGDITVDKCGCTVTGTMKPGDDCGSPPVDSGTD